MILDSVDFENNDIVIIDPCYVLSSSDYEDCYETSDSVLYGLQGVGLCRAVCGDTIINTWRMKIITAGREPCKLGEVETVTRFVAVLSLDEVKKYRPNFNYKGLMETGLATVIENFTGRVSIEQVDDRTISVVGQGSIDFYSKILE